MNIRNRISALVEKRIAPHLALVWEEGFEVGATLPSYPDAHHGLDRENPYEDDDPRDGFVARHLNRYIRGLAADAWERGFRDGMEWSPVSPGGVTTDPPPNPYKEQK